MVHKTNISTSIKFSFNPIIVRQLTFSLGNMYNNIMNNDGYMCQVVVENLWLDSTKKVPSIVEAFCVGMVEDVDASGYAYS
jgi:hypothetical protein